MWPHREHQREADSENVELGLHMDGAFCLGFHCIPSFSFPSFEPQASLNRPALLFLIDICFHHRRAKQPFPYSLMATVVCMKDHVASRREFQETPVPVFFLELTTASFFVDVIYEEG